MWRIFAILGLMVGALLPTLSFASDPSQDRFDIRPVMEISTDAFSIFQILVRARNAYDQEDFEQAANDYNILVQYDPSLEEAVIGAAKSYLALGQPVQAKNILSKSSFSTHESGVLLIIATSKTLDKNEAKAYLLQSFKTYQDSRLWNLSGHILMTEGATKSASDAFAQAERLGQKPGLLDNNLGMLAFQRGDLGTALKHFDRAVSLSPSTLKFDNNRRLALLLKGQYLKALESISSAREVNLLTDASIIASKRGDDLLAILLVKKSNEMNPVFNPLSPTRVEERPG